VAHGRTGGSRSTWWSVVKKGQFLSARILAKLRTAVIKFPHDVFFLRDASQKFRFFSSEPPARIPVQFSKPREIWEAAKKKLMLLPARIFYQEQAFMNVLKEDDVPLKIGHGDYHSDKKTRFRFYFSCRGRERAISPS